MSSSNSMYRSTALLLNQFERPMMFKKRNPIRKKVLIIAVVLATLAVAIGLTLYFVLRTETTEARFRGAVVSNGIECAGIGKSILEKEGSVVDAVIATLLCEGIANPQSMGLGGGFLGTIYIKSTGFAETINAREVAPLKADQNMFVNKTVTGGLAVAVPGEIKGYWELHQKYGLLKWAELFAPTIKLCNEGNTVSQYLATKLMEQEEMIMRTPSLREVYVDLTTGKVFKQGDKIKRPKLAETLRIVASEGVDAIYNRGSIGKMLVQDIQGFGGIITEEDLLRYNVTWDPPVFSKLNSYTVITTPLPGSGPVLSLILNLVSTRVTNTANILWQRVTEAFKHAYGWRTHLGDQMDNPGAVQIAAEMVTQGFAENLLPKIFDDQTFSDYTYYGANSTSIEDHGTANVAVLGPNGDAIVVTSTINNIFGSKIRSQQTGIILNDEMDDFSTPGKSNGFGLPPSPANFIKPGKRPLSSMVPTIVIDNNQNPRVLIGAAGGSKITTSVAQALIRHLLLDQTLDEAVQSPRIHHQLSPMAIQHEEDYSPDILNYLKNIRHDLQMIASDKGFSAVTAITSLSPEDVIAVFDKRRPGSVAYYCPWDEKC